MSGNKRLIKLLEEAKSMIKLLEEAKSTQSSKFSNHSEDITDMIPSKKCTVYPFHPWTPKNTKCYGVVLWVPRTIEELIEKAAEQLSSSPNSLILSEDAGKILDVDFISDGQKLYLISEKN